MEPEKTLDNKLKFFAQYFGQHVLKHKDWVNCVENNPTREDWNHSGMLLQLKPLESISDEDALQSWVNDNYIPKYEDIKFVANLFNPITAINADYLRSKGYALPWVDLTVQDLIDYGWIKLTEQ